MPTPTEDDDLDELPPPDGDVGDAPEAEAPVEADELDDPDGEASLDDKTGEDDPTDDEEIDIDEKDTGWLGEPADAPGLDIGEPAVVEFEQGAALEDAEEPRPADEDYGLGQGPEHVELDAGEEGPTDADEELRDTDLPALDADDEGDVEDAALVDATFGSDERLGVPWAAAPWDPVGAPLPLASALAVVCAGQGAVVAGRSDTGAWALLRVDLEGTSHVLGAEGLVVSRVRALRLGPGGALVAVDETSALFVSLDGGASFAPDEAPRPIDRIHDDPPGARIPVVRAELGLCAACAARQGGVLRATSDTDWTLHAWGGPVTAIALLDRAGTLVAATYADADDTTSLVRLDAEGVATVVARVGANREDPDSDGRVRALAHDEARGVVWLAGGFGVAALAVR